MTPTVRSILIEARQLIADIDHWTQNELAHDASGVPVSPNHRFAHCWCADGALQKVTGHKPNGPRFKWETTPEFLLYNAAADALYRATPKVVSDCHDYVVVNDGEAGIPDDAHSDRAFHAAHENILKVFDVAIAETA